MAKLPAGLEGATQKMGYRLPPTALLISGIDFTDENGHLEDSRASLKRGHDDVAKARMESIKRNGVIEPVVVEMRKVDGADKPVVIDGRQRVLDAREVECPDVPFVIKDVSDTDAERLAMELNALRTVDSQITEAYKAQRAIEKLGMTEEQVCQSMGWSKATLKNRLALLTLSSHVLALVHAGKLSPIAAVNISKMSHEEQDAAADEIVKLKEGGKGQTQASVVKRKQSKGDEDAAVKPSKSLVKKILRTDAAADLHEDVVRTFKYMIGEGSHTKIAGLAACLNEIEAKAAKRAAARAEREKKGATGKKGKSMPAVQKTKKGAKKAPTNRPGKKA